MTTKGMNLCALIIITLMCFTGSDAECLRPNLDTCVAPIVKYSADRSQFYWLGSFEYMCNELDGVNKCLKSAGCENDDMVVVVWWQRQKYSLEYVCGDQVAKRVMDYDTCLRNVSSTSKRTKCNSDYSDAIGADDTEECRAIDKYLKCTEDAVINCGSQVTRTYITYRYMLVNPRIRVQACDIKKPYVISSASEGIPSVFAFTAILVYLCAKDALDKFFDI